MKTSLSGIGIVLALIFTGFAGAQTKTVTFVTDKEKEGGYLCAITTAALNRAGYEVNIKFQPWARALKDVMDGTSQALLGCFYSDSRAKEMQYTKSIASSDIVFYKRKDSKATFTKMVDLRPFTIGTINCAVYTPEFDTASFIKKEPVATPVQNIKKLLAGRIDLFIENRAVVQRLLANEFSAESSKIVAIDPPLVTNKFYNAFSKKRLGYEQIVADFNKGLAQIRDDGTLRKILDQNLHE
jgi:polar amino acid transport system substrate-binding protein